MEIFTKSLAAFRSYEQQCWKCKCEAQEPCMVWIITVVFFWYCPFAKKKLKVHYKWTWRITAKKTVHMTEQKL